MRVLAFIALIGILSSCGAAATMRKSNRAANYIEKAKGIDPSIIEGKAVELPVTLPVPEKSGEIHLPIEHRWDADELIAEVVADPQQAPRIIREIVEAPCDTDSIAYEDDHLVGTFSISGGTAHFAYTTKPDSVSGTVTARTDIVNPTVYKARPVTVWAQLGLILFGLLSGVILTKIAIK